MNRVVRPLPKGQITIPVAMRRALGITEDTLLEVALDGDRIVVSKLVTAAGKGFRLYDDDEVKALLDEDQLSPEAAERVRDLMRRGLV